MVADCRLGAVQFLGGSGEAQVAGGGLERAQEGEMRQVFHGTSLLPVGPVAASPVLPGRVQSKTIRGNKIFGAKAPAFLRVVGQASV